MPERGLFLLIYITPNQFLITLHQIRNSFCFAGIALASVSFFYCGIKCFMSANSWWGGLFGSYRFARLSFEIGRGHQVHLSLRFQSPAFDCRLAMAKGNCCRQVCLSTDNHFLSIHKLYAPKPYELRKSELQSDTSLHSELSSPDCCIICPGTESR